MFLGFSANTLIICKLCKVVFRKIFLQHFVVKKIWFLYKSYLSDGAHGISNVLEQFQ